MCLGIPGRIIETHDDRGTPMATMGPASPTRSSPWAASSWMKATWGSSGVGRGPVALVAGSFVSAPSFQTSQWEPSQKGWLADFPQVQK